MNEKVLLWVRYDGAPFCGYQVQNNGPSVQAVLNHATEQLFGYPCDITGCSRTDSGVHALMFCATVTKKGGDTLPTSVPLRSIPRALNTKLPDAVAVREARLVPPDFHARYSVESKEYLYRFSDAPERDPFEAGRCWQIPTALTERQILRMQKAAEGFIGKRDFSACMAAGSSVVNTVRHVSEASVERAGSGITFRVRADGFLYHMVRIMAGTLIDTALGHIEPSDIPKRLDSLDRRLMGRTAPACGLYLYRVHYPAPFGFDADDSFPEGRDTCGT